MKLTSEDRQTIAAHIRAAADSMAAVYADKGPQKKGSMNLQLTQAGLSGCEAAIAQTDDREQAATHLRTLATALEALVGNTDTVVLELRETAVRLES